MLQRWRRTMEIGKSLVLSTEALKRPTRFSLQLVMTFEAH
ncbi:unnamed protein product [Brassica rapa subsp. narinosa]